MARHTIIPASPAWPRMTGTPWDKSAAPGESGRSQRGRPDPARQVILLREFRTARRPFRWAESDLEPSNCGWDWHASAGLELHGNRGTMRGSEQIFTVADECAHTIFRSPAQRPG